MKRIILLVLGVITICSRSNATTWFPAPHTCPICETKSSYQEIGSYGTYIYQWPSKYQYIYWPLTEGQSIYCCPECHFSTYMWDFDEVPKNKINEIKTYLSTLKVDKNQKIYTEIPITERLEIAEKVYKILGRDQEFWCKFYRVTGYHYEQNKNLSKAQEYRLKAMSLARILLTEPANQGREKEFYLIIAAMHHFTRQKDSASWYLERANAFVYKNSKLKEENSKNVDAYLTDLINQYKVNIKKGEED